MLQSCVGSCIIAATSNCTAFSALLGPGPGPEHLLQHSTQSRVQSVGKSGAAQAAPPPPIPPPPPPSTHPVQQCGGLARKHGPHNHIQPP